MFFGGVCLKGGRTFDHFYEAAGTYDVAVTVRNDAGQSTAKSIKLTVS